MYSPPLPSYINSLKMKDHLTFMSNVFFFYWHEESDTEVPFIPSFQGFLRGHFPYSFLKQLPKSKSIVYKAAQSKSHYSTTDTTLSVSAALLGSLRLSNRVI